MKGPPDYTPASNAYPSDVLGTLGPGRKPPNSDSYLQYKLVKSGSKITSRIRADHSIGDYDIKTTHKAVYNVKRGGKGDWLLQINPHIDKKIGSNRSIRYGLAIIVESTKNLDVYTEISKWMQSEIIQVHKSHEEVNKRMSEDQKISPQSQ